jgi:methionyl aminopeptidase
VPKRTVPKNIALPDHAATGIPYAERKQRFSHKIDVLTAKEIEGMRKVCTVISLEVVFDR